MLQIKCCVVTFFTSLMVFGGHALELDQLKDHFRKTIEEYSDLDQKTLVAKFYDFYNATKDSDVRSSPRNGFEYMTHVPYIKDFEEKLGDNDYVYENFNKFIIKARYRDSISINKTFIKAKFAFKAKLKLEELYNITFNNGKVIHTLIQNMQQTWCQSYPIIPFQHIIIKIYNAFKLSQFKCYIIEQFGNLIGLQYDTSVPLYPEEKLTEYIQGSTLKTDVRRCDPNKFERGKNFIQFTRLMQAFIKGLGNNNTKIHYDDRCTWYDLQECMYKIAEGKVCLSSLPNRRYDYIQESNGDVLGKLQHCGSSKIQELNNNHTICLCDETNKNTDKYISLRKVSANVKDNRVVTGIKFVKPHRVVHLQVQEGKLLANGDIDQTTVGWIPIDDFNITDNKFKVYDRKTEYAVYNKVDYFLLTSKSRTVSLDEIETNDDDYVMTGLQLILNDDNIIQLNIDVTQFNWVNGKLNPATTKRLFNDITNRDWLNLTSADIPTHTNTPSELKSHKPMYINFTITDLNKDAGQTTIPYLDAQEVTTQPATPLIGAGLFYKGIDGYGGFIAPVLKTFNYLDKILDN